MEKSTIYTLAESSFETVTSFTQATEITRFYTSTEVGKWSAAENLLHLNLAMKRTNLAMRLPKFIIRLITGKPNRASRNYENLLTRYHAKLAEGAVASAAVIPQIENKSKSLLLQDWQRETQDFLDYLQRKWTEDELDNYLAPHPILGKITIRELCYFTIFHAAHHLEIMKKRI